MGEIDRRKFIALSGASAAALVFGAGPFTEKALAQPRFRKYPFSLGVARRTPRKPAASGRPGCSPGYFAAPPRR